jgi:hypothetical protein
LHVEFGNVVKAQSNERLMAEDVISASIEVRCELPKVSLRGECRKDITLRVNIDVAAPEIKLDNFRIMEGRSAAEDAGESLASFDKFIRLIHRTRVKGLMRIRRKNFV